MRKNNKLYTANKWNQPLFARGVDRVHQNIFDGLFQSTLNTPTSVSKTTGLFSQPSGLNYQTPQLSKPTTSMPIDWSNAGQRITATQGVNTMVNNFGNEAKANNPFSQYAKDDSGSSMSGLAQAGIGAAMTIGDNIQIGNSKRGLWDAADPVYHLAGGRESAVGNGLSDAGVGVFKASAMSGNGVGMLAGAGLKILGGLTNAAFGTKWNKDTINRIETNASNMKSSAAGLAGVSTSDDFLNRASNVASGGYNFSKKDIGKDGWFTNKVGKKYNKLKNAQADAQNYVAHAMTTGAQNVDKTLDDNVFANFSAFGGQLGAPSGGGAIDYGFMSDYLTMRNNATKVKDKVPTNPFGSLPVTPLSTFALGGDIQTNSADFSTGLTHIDAGGSHESNPYDGIQVGISTENGQPNLVEEGETIFDDYVFSKRIRADKQTKEKFHIGKNADISFADLSKKLEKESLERPNDAISQAGLKKQMHDLADEQERQKGEQQQREAEEAFEQLPPEQQQAIMQQIAMEEQQAQAQQMQGEQPTEQPPMEGQQEPQQMVDENMQGQMEPQINENGEQINACGGKMNRFDKGGDMKRKVYSLLPNVHTDRDFDKWANEHKLPKVTDWEHILQNKQFVEALSGVNPAIGDAVSKGYDFGNYKAPTGKYDLEGFKKTLDGYTKSKTKGNLAGNYAIDNDFNLGKNKTIRELEESPDYKAYTQYMKDIIKRNKGIELKYKSDDHTYDNIDWKDSNKKISREDYDILKNALQHQINGTAVNPDGNPVPIWSKIDNDGYFSLNDNADTLFERYRTDGKGGIFHFTPNEINRDNQVVNRVINEDGTIDDIIGDVPKDWTGAGNYSWQDAKSDYTYNYYKRPSAGTPADGSNAASTEEQTLEPKHKPTWGRYAGLFGPAVSLGMQAMGIGKPDYSRMDAAVDAASGAPALASYRPIGNYIGYRPMDIWYEQNRLNANSRATDRAILNNASPVGTKMAGLLANGYNEQIGSGNLYRQALEYNDAQRQKVADFNRGTDMFNAQAFNQTSATNAQLQNSHRNFKAQMQMDAARERLNTDASWTNSLYGNVSKLFDNFADWGRENQQHNTIANMAYDGLFGTMSDKQAIAKEYLTTKKTKKAKGGRINRRRGLTF